MAGTRIMVAGGGAAGFFAAIACAECCPSASVTIVEKSVEFLSKVRISGGGRCNVTHACFDPRKLSEFYPRGGQALIGPFHRFQPGDTVAWFESRGVKLRTEEDGRIFPISNCSQSIVDCLLKTARKAGVRLISGNSVQHAKSGGAAPFRLDLQDGTRADCERLMLATGGCRTPSMARLAHCLGHSLMPPVPSLFAFRMDTSWLKPLAGISVSDATLSIPGTKLAERGPLLITHAGMSGPAVLRLSAWGARDLSRLQYRFAMRINWFPSHSGERLNLALKNLRKQHPGKKIGNTPLSPMPSRLWQALVERAGMGFDMRWSGVSNAQQTTLLAQLAATEVPITGKSMNRDEFVTCGGIPLAEVDFKSMQSCIVPGLFFGGEVLDIDGLTGGFNFQAAWTTGWIAGRAMGGQTA